jgi:N-acylneuraminate cytidylyltransferase
MKPLVVIPARAGSKGVPGKNIKALNGKPLILYTVEAARAVFPDAVICVSTDSEEIKQIVEKAGLSVPFLRPDELATDTATTQEVLKHALTFYQGNGYNPDVVILLQVTSPFRTDQHIREALKLYTTEIDMVVSVKETSSNPYYVLFLEEEGYLKKVLQSTTTRRQDLPKVWEYNGALYLINAASLQQKNIAGFERVVKYVMDEYASHDIDTMLDWQVAEQISKTTFG